VTQLPAPSSSVIVKHLNDGGVLYCTRTEVYFGVNKVGVAIWSALPPISTTLEALLERIGEQFPDAPVDEIRDDALEFLEQLLRHGLVVAPEPHSSAP